MVNPGGTSKGCRTCIRRRVKCDQQHPICGQCRKGNRECGGYRDPKELVFRDQSQKVIAKANSGSRRHPRHPVRIGGQRSRESSEASDADAKKESVSDEVAIVRSPKLEEGGSLINFFANNYTFNDDVAPRTNLFWVPPNLDEILKDKSANLSIQSVGAMALARLKRSPHYYREAQKKYGSALLSLADGWREAKQANSDAAFITILFLGFFEVLAAYDSAAKYNYMTHLNAIGSLLAERGKSSVASGFTAQMMLQSRAQAIMFALKTKTAVPKVFSEPAPSIRMAVPAHVKNAEELDRLMIRLAELQAEIQFPDPVNTLLADLYELDGLLIRWEAKILSLWGVSIHQQERRSDSWWDTRHDVYSAPSVAHMLNRQRACRIMIHDLRQELYTRLSLAPTIDAKASTDIGLGNTSIDIRRVVIDVCATVPILYRPSRTTPTPDEDDNLPSLGTTFWLLWPLEVVGAMREAPFELTMWTQHCFERIFEITGNIRAQAAAERLYRRHRPTAAAIAVI